MTETIFKTLSPDWPQISNVKAYTILATSPNDEKITFSGNDEAALRSKELLLQWTGIDTIHWLYQVHDDMVLELPDTSGNTADGAITSVSGVICAVRTADCLPVVFTTASGSRVAVAHAGWKGLRKGILLKTIATLNEKPETIFAWIGPAIAQNSYEVGPELRDAFMETDPMLARFFKQGEGDRYFADLAGIARFQMESVGVPSQQITGGEWDSFTDSRFHSYRRDGDNSGRMLTLVWIDNT
jgi:YfiH family protein